MANRRSTRLPVPPAQGNEPTTNFRIKGLCFAFGIAVLLAVIAVFFFHKQPAREKAPYFHNEAAKEFYGLVKGGLKAEREAIAEAFLGAFEEGMLAEDVQDLLNTARNANKEGDVIKYRWYSEIDDGRVFYVEIHRGLPSAADNFKKAAFVVKTRDWYTLPS